MHYITPSTILSTPSMRELGLENKADIILFISTSLSIIGCFLIILTYSLYKDIRTPSRHIIVCISIADLVVSLANMFADIILNPKDYLYNDLCEMQSFIGTTAVNWSFMWTMMLAVYLFISLVKDKPRLAHSLLYPWFHLLCWLFPLTINVIALVLHKLGNNEDIASSGWCWIKVQDTDSNKGPLIWMIIDGKGLELLTYFVIAILYILVKCHLQKQIQNFQKGRTFSTSGISSLSIDAARLTDRKLIFVPVAFIVLRIWGTIRFFIYLTNKQGQHKHFEAALLVLQTLGDNLIGAVNCILFCFLTPKVWNHLKESCKGVFKNIYVGCCNCCSSTDEPLNLLVDERTLLI